MYREAANASGYAYRQGGTSSPPAGVHHGDQGRRGSTTVQVGGAGDIEGNSGSGRPPSVQAQSGALRARSPPLLGGASTATSPERAPVATTIDQRTTSMDRRTVNPPGRRVPQFNPARPQAGQTQTRQAVQQSADQDPRFQVGHVRPKAAPLKTQDIESLKDLMGYATSHPSSEAPSCATLPTSQVASMGTAPSDLDRLSIEGRVKRLENSLEERLIKVTSEAMNACVTLCKASEERSMQKIEALRRDMQLERANVPSEALEDQHTGLVDAISRSVLEKVKEDQCIRNVSEQHDQLKEAIKDLRSMPQLASKSTAGGDSRSPDCNSLHDMIKEMMKISYSLAKELGMEKDQRNREFAEASQRLEAMEQVITIDGAVLSQASNLRSLSQGERRGMRLHGTAQQGTPVDNGSSLERVICRLKPLAVDDPKSSSARLGGRPPTMSPTARSRSFRDSSVHSQGSEESGSQDWSSEVRALRTRLENIFQLNNGAQDSLSAGSTVGSLPTVQESSVPGDA